MQRSKIVSCPVEMHDVFVVTPLLATTVSQPYTFGHDICIREVQGILWDTAVAKSVVSEHDRDELNNTAFWLCVRRDPNERLVDGADEYGRARNAAMALQIICPTGGKHVFLKLQEVRGGWDNLGSQHPKPLCTTHLSRRMSTEEQGLTHWFDPVYAGVRRSLQEETIRLVNPILLLEHGMQIGNPALATLMFVMGLDVLFMAGENHRFVARVGGFLGLDTLVFPRESLTHQQPRTTVGEVLGDLYELRNAIAHGQEIPKHPYREPRNLISIHGQRIGTQNLVYGDLLLDASLYLLTGCLRRIFVEGLYEDVAHAERWKRRMTLYEHRYKNTGGHNQRKTRGKATTMAADGA